LPSARYLNCVPKRRRRVAEKPLGEENRPNEAGRPAKNPLGRCGRQKIARYLHVKMPSAQNFELFSASLALAGFVGSSGCGWLKRSLFLGVLHDGNCLGCMNTE